MKRIVIATIATVGLLSTAVYAYGNKGNACNMQPHHGKKMHVNASMQQNCMQKQGMQNNSGVRSFMQVLHQLNLSTEQYDKIRSIMHAPMPKQESMFVAFSKDSFDKDKFMKQMAQKRENMLKSKADKIEKIYNVLTSKQKSQLRVLMDLQEEKGN